MELTVGITGWRALAVTEENTALAVGSGTLRVFATPSLAALIEQTCWESIAPALAPEKCTVGTRLELSHNAPTPVGGTAVCESTLTEFDGRKLTFHVTVKDAAGEVAVAEHERFIVDSERFQTKADARQKA